ncbi:MAG: pentapeptide repeat-containing protein [Pseudomonadota bacterium]
MSEENSQEPPKDPPADPPEAAAQGDPRELLTTANGASGPARNAWLAFLGLLAYLLITLAGVTHVDLLLNSPVTLPIANVKIPLFSFFLAAPFLFVLVHLGLLVQHAMLAHKYHHFSEAIAAGETVIFEEKNAKGEVERITARDHPDRRLVHNYVFSQLLAGPKAPFLLEMLMRLMVFMTLSLLPVLVLLYFQIKFLPSHDVAITHAHRLAIVIDLALLFIVRPYIAMPYLRPQGRKVKLGSKNWRWEISTTSLGITGTLSVLALLFSLLVATVPHGCAWPFGTQSDDCFSLDRMMAKVGSVEVTSGELTRDVFAPTKWLFEGKPDRTTGAPESIFSRNLVVTDRDLVEKKTFEAGETSLPLRGRDLRFAVLDRSDLRRADLFGSDLRGLSGSATQFDHGEFGPARLQGANLSLARMRGANLEGAQMQGANLEEAQMQGANLSSARLQGARLSYTRLQDGDLSRAQLSGADLGAALLQGARLGGATMHGVDLHDAEMQGVDLSSAQMHGADLRTAQLQGADLSSAQLQGADLRFAHLQGASLVGTRLQGADLRNAKMQTADLSAAHVWQTGPPEDKDMAFAISVRRSDIAPLGPDGRKALEALLAGTADQSLRKRLRQRLGRLLSDELDNTWKGSGEHEFWVGWSNRPKPDPAAFANYLTNLACSEHTGGYVVKGVARRLPGAEDDYAKLVATILIEEDGCPSARHLSEDLRVVLKRFVAVR